MASIFDGLSNLPIFEGASDEARRRALLNAGLAMMQPQGQFENTIGSISTGISAGLQSLDQTRDREAATEQQQTDNVLRGRQVAASEQQADAQMMTAETGQQRAATEAAAQAEDARQFDLEGDLRAAKIDLDKAQAEWLRRRHDGTPAGSDGKVTPAMIDQSFVLARMENLYRADPQKYTLADGKRNVELLMDQAFLDLHRVTGTAGNENVPIIASSAEDAAGIGANVTAMQGVAPAPASATPETKQLSTQAEVDALPSGTRFLWVDGKEYTKQ